MVPRPTVSDGPGIAARTRAAGDDRIDVWRVEGQQTLPFPGQLPSVCRLDPECPSGLGERVSLKTGTAMGVRAT